jgi:hypothetical protein
MPVLINVPGLPSVDGWDDLKAKFNASISVETLEDAFRYAKIFGHQRVLLASPSPVEASQLIDGWELEAHPELGYAPQAAPEVATRPADIVNLMPGPITSVPPAGVPIFTNASWEALCASTWTKINGLAKSKGVEYSGDVDRLANFRKQAEIFGVQNELIWAIYAGKHWDSIVTYINDIKSGKTRVRSEPISGRVDDLLVYLLLLKAMLIERGEA